MNKHEPKPLIEHHYHIQELIDAQEKRVEDRNRHREREKERAERDDIIKDAKVVVVTDFWCEHCKQDFKSMAIKQVEKDWTADQDIAFYKTKCDQGHWCIRLITDRQRDAFWVKSKLMVLDRGNHYADTLQPWETGFNLLYGRKHGK